MSHRHHSRKRWQVNLDKFPRRYIRRPMICASQRENLLRFWKAESWTYVRDSHTTRSWPEQSPHIERQYKYKTCILIELFFPTPFRSCSCWTSSFLSPLPSPAQAQQNPNQTFLTGKRLRSRKKPTKINSLKNCFPRERNHWIRFSELKANFH